MKHIWVALQILKNIDLSTLPEELCKGDHESWIPPYLQDGPISELGNAFRLFSFINIF